MPRILFIALILTLVSGTLLARNIYVNGVDISGATNQNLRKVDLHINSRGDIYIRAPHYQVHEENSYIPLSSYLKESDAVEHKPIKGIEDGGMRGGGITTPVGQNVGSPSTSKKPIALQPEDVADILNKPVEKIKDIK